MTSLYPYILFLTFASAASYVCVRIILRSILSKHFSHKSLEKMEKCTGTIIILVALYLICKYINLPEFVIKIVQSFSVLIIVIVVYKIIELLIDKIKFNKKHIKKMIGNTFDTVFFVIANICKIATLFAGVLYLLSIWQIDITPILASAGIVGIIVGFALKDVLENIFAGLILLLDPPFKVGDIVQIENKLGEVIEIGVRNTKIKLLDNTIISIPNSKIINSELINYTMPNDIIRITLTIGVSYDTNPQVVKETIMEILEETPEVLKDPQPKIFFREYGSYALIFDIWFWTKIKYMFEIKDKINSKIWKKFKEKGIVIPYPIETIYLHNEK